MKTPRKIVLGLLRSILGIGTLSCAAYGIPSDQLPDPPPAAEYKLNGTVVDSNTGAAIPGISIAFESTTVTSATDGTWSMDVHGSYCGGFCDLYVWDTDDAANGSYLRLTLQLAPTQTTLGSGPRDKGVFEQKDIQLSLVAKP